MRRALLAATAGTLLLGSIASAAVPAKGAQRRALIGALQRAEGDVGISGVTLSTADPHYALVRWGAKGNENDLYLLARRGWVSVWRREFDRPADGACAYAPANVVHDLLAVTCPSAKALHARPASAAVVAELGSSLETSKLTPYWRDAKALRPACVSRLNANWAAAQARFSGSSAVIWFERKGAWRPVYESVIGGGTPPPASVLLSLASCVGYSAAEYGA